MRLLVTTLVLFATLGEYSQAQVRKFPYEAVIEADKVNVRSGPGRKTFYRTGHLHRGDRVTVHRHDPGGWYVISPPEGSFNWVRAEYVKRVDKRHGIVTKNDVVVWVGSEFNCPLNVTQSLVSRTDEVEILGEATTESERGSVRMYKIAPLRYEFRWILGKYVTPINAIARRQRDHDPYSTPSNAQRPTPDAHLDDEIEHKSKDNFTERKIVRTHKKNAVRRSGPSSDELQADRDRLKKLDARFRAIVSRDTKTWNFSRLHTDYHKLHDETSVPAISSQIDLRFSALDRYGKIKSEYDELIKLTSATNQRDQELLAIQNKLAQVPADQSDTTIEGPALAGPPTPEPSGASATSSTTVTRQPNPTVQPQPTGRWRPRRRNQSYGNAGNATPHFDGAGIIQRNTRTTHQGTPRHVLLAPSGRVLAYLRGAPGVNLDIYLGRSMGLHGRRWHRADMHSDFMIVHRLRPVRLMSETNR